MAPAREPGTLRKSPPSGSKPKTARMKRCIWDMGSMHSMLNSHTASIHCHPKVGIPITLVKLC
eukprot:2168504-Amphidinium_carterae.2